MLVELTPPNSWTQDLRRTIRCRLRQESTPGRIPTARSTVSPTVWLMWRGGKVMEVKYTHCAGLDVHKKSVVVCRITPQDDGWREETRTFGTMTPDLLILADWLREAGVTQVAMESTGVYWKPIYNLLESEFDIILVNAKHIKYVPGRKTDVKDAQWIAQLLQHGLLKASFVPPMPQRHLRDLVRYRTKLIQDRTQEVNRIQKVLEDANLKLASVVSDVMGLSARDMLSSLIAGQDDPSHLAQLARGRMRSKIDE